MQNLFLRESFNVRRQIYAALPNEWARTRARVLKLLRPVDLMTRGRLCADVTFWRSPSQRLHYS